MISSRYFDPSECCPMWFADTIKHKYFIFIVDHNKMTSFIGSLALHFHVHFIKILLFSKSLVTGNEFQQNKPLIIMLFEAINIYCILLWCNIYTVVTSLNVQLSEERLIFHPHKCAYQPPDINVPSNHLRCYFLVFPKLYTKWNINKMN